MLAPLHLSRHAAPSAGWRSLLAARWLRAGVALLMLWVSVLPALSHAMVAAGGEPGRLVQVCTSSGMAWLVVDSQDRGDTPTPPTPNHDSDGHCAWCLSHVADAAGPMAAAAAGMPPPVASRQLAQRAPMRRADDAPPSAPPRGPPLLPR